MNTTTAYTPLECLLLFQSLVAYGTQEDDFVRISDLLTNNSLVKDEETYNAQRLSRDALQELYLQLLGEQLNQEENGQEEESQTISKKRKIQSPPLPSIKGAQEYGNSLPLLVDRLYARYRDYMVRAIKEDERKYAVIQKDITEIERGEWDERILKEDGVVTNKNGSLPPKDSRIQMNGANSPEIPKDQPPEPIAQPTKEAPMKITPPTSSPSPDVLATSDVLNNQETPAPSPHLADERSRNGSQGPLLHQRKGSNGPHGPSPLHSQPLASQPSHPPHQNAWTWQTPQYQPGTPQQFHPSQYPPQYAQPQRASFSSPHGLPPSQHSVPSSPMNPQQAIHLPPVNGRGSPMSPGVPSMPGMELLADAAGQQYRANPVSPMMHQPGGYAPSYAPHQHPPPGGGPQWHPLPMQAQNMQYPPNFQQFPPQNQQRQPPFPQPPLVPPQDRHYNSPYNGQGQKPPVPFPPHIKPSRSRSSVPSTPVSQNCPMFMTGTGTKWTPTPTGLTPKPHGLPNSPAVEPISPILRTTKLPGSAKKPIKKQAHKEDPKPKAPWRRGQHGRAGSVASSIVAGSHRSQSVMSHADELSMDEPVKEEVATPMGIEDAGDTTADESIQPRLPLHHLSPRPSTKRKRVIHAPEPQLPSTPPSHVLWTKAFPKISISALESVSGHKNASTFAAPVKERDAPGYKNLILRPQDLKTIRSAILAGHRAATAAAPEDMNPSATSAWLPVTEDLIPPKGIINYAQLEKELMRMFANAIMFNPDPDRGLCRRWQGIGKDKGDVVGYEFDEDGVVKDTRAMFADVEKIVGSLRAAERRSEKFWESNIAIGGVEDDDIDELAGDGESIVGDKGSMAKRRRKA